MLEPDPTGEIRTEDAYQVYQSWCARNGQYSEGMPAWKQRMEAHTMIKRKRPAGAPHSASKISLILGVKWKVGPAGSGIFLSLLRV